MTITFNLVRLYYRTLKMYKVTRKVSDLLLACWSPSWRTWHPDTWQQVSGEISQSVEPLIILNILNILVWLQAMDIIHTHTVNTQYITNSRTQHGRLSPSPLALGFGWVILISMLFSFFAAIALLCPSLLLCPRVLPWWHFAAPATLELRRGVKINGVRMAAIC